MGIFKNIVAAIIFTLSGFVFSQDSRIFENTWYLHSLNIEGVQYIPPVNDEIPYVSAEFIKPDLFESGMCESGMGGQVLFNGTSYFSFLSLAMLAGGCYENYPINEDFNYLYQTFFIEASNQENYNYTINENGSVKTLILVKENGDEAIYGNELLANNEFTKLSAYIYPNPTNYILFINKKHLESITKAIVYDINGRVLPVNFSENSGVLQVDVNTLDKGIYFVSVISDTKKFTSKFIKQ